MKHNVIIQKEFIKYSSKWWNFLPSEKKMRYLRLHPESKYSNLKVKDRVIIEDDFGDRSWATVKDMYLGDDERPHFVVDDDKTNKRIEIDESKIIA